MRRRKTTNITDAVRPIITDIKRLRVEPGDHLIVVLRDADPADLQEARVTFDECWPGVPVVLASGPVEMVVVNS